MLPGLGAGVLACLPNLAKLKLRLSSPAEPGGVFAIYSHSKVS
jgi:hypothetical protein